MNGTERLAAIDRGTPSMAAALPDLPMAETVMVRLLRVAVVGLGQYFEPAFRSLDLTESNFHVLCILMASEDGSASPSELSELVGASRANMSRILDSLSAEGLVLREVSAVDARRAIVRITAKGQERAESALPLLAAPIRTAFADLTRDEFAGLDRLLRRVVQSFDRASQERMSA